MVQKESKRQEAPKRRGRPRAYDPDAALARAIGSFWKAGYSGTSLDDLSAATGMNRPSLYGAFGDKRDLYLKALARYWDLSRAAMDEALAHDLPLRQALQRLYDKALSIYFSGKEGPRGCFAIGTATTEAVHDAKIRASLAQGFRMIDDAFEARIRLAQDQGELQRGADPAALGMLASATLHTLAIRSRSSVSLRILSMSAAPTSA
jgi:AcrR family transcriptional regulator